jgi:hypothetical protein
MEYSRLLKYRTLDRLWMLDDDGRLALLSELLDGSPSEDIWQSVCELFAMWPESAAKDRALGLADREMATWDDRLRCLSSSWMPLYDQAGLSSLAILVRIIQVSGRSERADADLSRIAESKRAHRLTRLIVDRSEPDTLAWEQVARSEHLTALQHLHIRHTMLAAEGLNVLLRTQTLRSVSCLRLNAVGLTPRRLSSAEQFNGLPGLRRLDMGNNLMSGQGLKLLARAPLLQRLDRIDLQMTNVDANGVTGFLASEFLREGTQVDVRNNRIHDSERPALAAEAANKGVALLV